MGPSILLPLQLIPQDIWPTTKLEMEMGKISCGNICFKIVAIVFNYAG